MAVNTVVASAARTTNGVSATFPLGGLTTVNLEAVTSAVTGTTPNMVLTVLWSLDGVNFGANDGAADSFAAITAVGNVVKQVPVRGPYMQVQWTITGTSPNFTFSVVQGGLNP